MARYNTTLLIKDQNGKRRRSTTIFPVIPKSNNDIYILTTNQERLDKLALSFYDDVSMWWIIAAANGLGKGTIVIPSNTNIRIPDKNNITDILIDINTTR